MLKNSAPLRILLVEDEPLFAELLAVYLENMGYEPLGPSENATQALALCQEGTWPDLALLDINLRGPVDGVELAQQLVARRPLPLIFLTSQQDRESFDRARRLGPAAYLVKPITPEALQRAIELAIANFAAGHGSLPIREDEPANAPVFAEANTGVLLPEALFVKEDGVLVKVRLPDVRWVEADGVGCRLALADRVVQVNQNLRELAPILSAMDFVQIESNYLVNAHHIERVDPVRNLVQVGGQLLPLTSRYRDELLRRLQLAG
jgi:DNA-binding LytR/AlgR family response regulator